VTQIPNASESFCWPEHIAAPRQTTKTSKHRPKASVVIHDAKATLPRRRNRLTASSKQAASTKMMEAPPPRLLRCDRGATWLGALPAATGGNSTQRANYHGCGTLSLPNHNCRQKSVGLNLGKC